MGSVSKVLMKRWCACCGERLGWVLTCQKLLNRRHISAIASTSNLAILNMEIYLRITEINKGSIWEITLNYGDVFGELNSPDCYCRLFIVIHKRREDFDIRDKGSNTMQYV